MHKHESTRGDCRFRGVFDQSDDGRRKVDDAEW